MKNTPDFQKKTPLLLAHYRALFAHADYVYMVSDSASCGAGDLLRDLALGSSLMKNTPLIMVKPGLELLCQMYHCDVQEYADDCNCPPMWEDRAPLTNPITRRELFKLYSKSRRMNVKSLSTHGLHVMLSADSTWDESGNLIQGQEKAWGDINEERALQLAVMRKRRDCTQIVISQSSHLLLQLRELCQTGIKGAPNADGLLTLSVNDEGYLYDPFEAKETETDLLARLARKKLHALVQAQPVYIDDSALRHPQASEMLQNIKQGLLQAGKQLVVLANKKEPLALSEVLIDRAQEEQPTVRFVWLRDSLGKTEALSEALLTDTAALPNPSQITFITDRVTRAEKLQQQLAGSGILLQIYSVNKHGFLSNRDKTKPALTVGNTLSVSTAQNKQKMEHAIKSGDIETALSLVSDKDALKNGVITSLCEKRADMLEQLLHHADKIQGVIINWWILEYKQFLSPSFLLENPKFYDLLVLALSKCRFNFTQAEKWLGRLQELEDAPTAAKVELSFLISLLTNAINKATGISGITRIRHADIPKELPRSERSETDLLRMKMRELEQKQESLTREIERLQFERFEIDRQIALLNIQLSAKS